MDTTELVDQIRDNLVQVKYHADLYFNKSKPVLTDAQFDKLVKDTQALINQLENADSQNPYITEAIDTLNDVGAEPTYGKTITHPSIMGSLEKVNELPDLFKFVSTGTQPGKETLVLMTPKVDGLSIRIVYEDGKLKLAATRGSGSVGQDVTDNVKYITSIPKTIKHTGALELRGEIYMKRSTFKNCGVVFKNPRNAASGILAQKDPKETGKVALHLFVYDVKADQVFPTEGHKEEFVNELEDFDFVPCEYFKDHDSAAIQNRIRTYETETRQKLDYDIDGLVFTFNDRDIQEDLGWRGKCPLGKIAFKFKPEQGESDVENIQWQMGRQGRLTPVVIIKPTLIAGSTITKASVHNFRMVINLKLRIGSKVIIEKKGDIIPQVVSVVNPMADDEYERFVMKSLESHLNYPTLCPSCKKETKLDVRGVSVWCLNPLCPEKIGSRVLHYLKMLEIKEIGEKSIFSMQEAGMIHDIPDLYYLDAKAVASITGGKRSAEIIIGAIMDKNKLPIDSFLAALGISELGKTTAKALSKKYKTLAAIRALGYAELCSIGGIGDTVAHHIQDGLKEMANTIDRIVECVEIVDVQESTGPLKGFSFCFTGAMESPRKELEKMTEQFGGECKSSVGRGLTYLVMADANSTSSKAEKARKVGTKCISEVEFKEMCKGTA